MVSTTAISVGILIVVLVIMIVFALVMLETYKNDTFVFTPYTPPPPPANTFFPLGNVTPLTQEEIEARNAVILSSAGAAT
jgi:hypothetical protein